MINLTQSLTTNMKSANHAETIVLMKQMDRAQATMFSARFT